MLNTRQVVWLWAVLWAIMWTVLVIPTDYPQPRVQSMIWPHSGEGLVTGTRLWSWPLSAAAEETVIDACHLFPRNPEWNDMLKHCNLQSVIHIHYSFMLDSPLPTWQSDKIRNVNIAAPLWEIGYRLDVVILIQVPFRARDLHGRAPHCGHAKTWEIALNTARIWALNPVPQNLRSI